MKKEDELYIESYVCKLVSLCAEADYKIDRLGNIVFQNKKRVVKNINKIILGEIAKGIEATEEEIYEYLIKIYQERSENLELTREANEIILILKSFKEVPVTGENDNNKKTEEVR